MVDLIAHFQSFAKEQGAAHLFSVVVLGTFAVATMEGQSQAQIDEYIVAKDFFPGQAAVDLVGISLTVNGYTKVGMRCPEPLKPAG